MTSQLYDRMLRVIEDMVDYYERHVDPHDWPDWVSRGLEILSEARPLDDPPPR
jgi:hypothetical protein